MDTTTRVIFRKFSTTHILFLLALCLIVFFIIPVPSFAADETSIGGPKLSNPINANSIFALLELVIDALIKIAVPVASIVIMFAGFKFIMARGSGDEITKAKELLWAALIGIALILISKVLITVLQTTIERLQL